MFSLVLTAAFGILGALSIYLARRDEEGRTFFWIMATLCALAFGFSLGSFNQDARLRNEIATLRARLQTEGSAAVGPLETAVETRVNDAVDDAGDNAAGEAVGEGVGDAPDSVGSVPDTPSQVAFTAPPTASASPTVSVPPTASALPAPSDVVLSAPAPLTPPPDTPEADVLRSVTTATGTGLPEPEPARALPVTATDVRLSELAGTWEMTTTIERTAYPTYLGLELTFRLDVTASGGTFSALGNKTAERAPGAARTLSYAPSAANRIALTGAYVDADTLAVSFEEGVDAQGGTMTLNAVSPQRLEGVFSSSAAASGGSVVWRKLSGPAGN